MKSKTSNSSKQKSKIQEMQRFYDWLLKTRNVHLCDNDKIMKACEIVTQSHKSFMRVPNRNQIL